MFPDAQHEILIERPPVRAHFFRELEGFLAETGVLEPQQTSVPPGRLLAAAG